MLTCLFGRNTFNLPYCFCLGALDLQFSYQGFVASTTAVTNCETSCGGPIDAEPYLNWIACSSPFASMNATKSSQAFPLSLWSARLPTQRRRSSVIWERTLSNKLGSVMPFNNSVSVLFTAPVPSRLIEPSAASDANNDGAPSIFRSTETPVMLSGSIIFLAGVNISQLSQQKRRNRIPHEKFAHLPF